MLPGAKGIGYTEKSYILDAMFSGLTSPSFLGSHMQVGGIHGHWEARNRLGEGGCSKRTIRAGASGNRVPGTASMLHSHVDYM